MFNDVFVCTGTFDPAKPGSVTAAPSSLAAKEAAAGGSKAKGEFPTMSWVDMGGELGVLGQPGNADPRGWSTTYLYLAGACEPHDMYLIVT